MDGSPYRFLSSCCSRLRGLWLELKQWESRKNVQIGFSVKEMHLILDAYSGSESEFEDSDRGDHDSEYSDSEKDYLDLGEEHSNLKERSDLENAGLDSLQVLIVGSSFFVRSNSAAS